MQSCSHQLLSQEWVNIFLSLGPRAEGWQETDETYEEQEEACLTLETQEKSVCFKIIQDAMIEQNVNELLNGR